MKNLLWSWLCILLAFPAEAGQAPKKPRARDLGIIFAGTPGAFNAITDVPGVTVGYTTLIRALQRDKAVRTGITAIFPRALHTLTQPVFAGYAVLNGNGEMTGSAWMEESGFLEGPVMLTNTHSVGVVHDAVIHWMVQHGKADNSGYFWSLPVVAETWDGYLNDINGFHIKPEHAFAALDSAKSGLLEEGNVGGGTGMICFEFKCGTGTSSRVIQQGSKRYTLGALVQANFGMRSHLRISGVPVGEEISHDLVWSQPKDNGSIIVVLATDAPLLPHQLKRLARRASLGLGRNGSISGNGSGDIFLAFSVANASASQASDVENLAMLANDNLDSLFEAAVQSTEEAVVNALVAAETMLGNEKHRAIAIPREELLSVLRKYNRLAPSTAR